MDTGTSTQNSKHMQETLKSTADLYKKASHSILEAYSKQLKTSADWWQKCVELTINSGFPKRSSEIFPELIRKNTETYQKTLNETIGLSKDVAEKILNAWGNENSVSLISKEVSDAVLNIFRKQSELITGSGKQLLSSVKEYNLEDFKQQFDFLITDTIKSSEKSIEYLMDEYNLKTEFTKKSSEELTANITKQFDALTEMNTRFFNELQKSFAMEKKIMPVKQELRQAKK